MHLREHPPSASSVNASASSVNAASLHRAHIVNTARNSAIVAGALTLFAAAIVGAGILHEHYPGPVTAVAVVVGLLAFVVLWSARPEGRRHS